MSTYVQEFAKLAAADSEPGIGRHLGNAALIAGGVGLGAGVGTLAAHAFKEHVPEALKSKWLPAGIGLSAGALSLLISLRDQAKRERLNNE